MGMKTSKIICADSIKALDQIDEKSIQLVVTSPPYNIGKEYEQGVRMSLEEYLEWLEPIIEKLCSKISNSGSICWQVGNYVNKGEVFPLDLYFYEMFRKCGFKLRNRMIWHFNFGLHASNRFSGRYETVLWFTRTDEYIFNLDPVRVPQLYPGKRHSAKKGGKAGELSGNPLGKNPSDFWEFSPEEAFSENPLWNLPNVKSNHPEKTQHPCQFPSELAERCILALSNSGDTILDPFVGSGTTVIAALKHDRVGVGIDKSKEYAALSRERIQLFKKGELKLRRAGKIIRKPKSGERVSTIPEEWIEKAS
ncbi:MAG: site-specific DNA-methyltransferase [Robiginitomaculum sp.]|nr:site-specific DNA-methyltransferase [Robiginitomaculum sp.]